MLDRLGPDLQVGLSGPGMVSERPAPRVLHAERDAAPPAPATCAGLAALRGHQQRAQTAEAVRGDEAERTSSVRASSTCERNRPAPSTSSSKKDAPCSRMHSRTACARVLGL